MKISIYHEFIYPYQKGGGEVQRWNIAKYLSKFGHEVKLIGYRNTGQKNKETTEGVKIIRIGRNIDSSDQIFRRIPGILHMIPEILKDDSKIILTNPFLPILVTLPLAKLKGKKVCVTWDDVFDYKTLAKHRGILIGVIGTILEYAGIFMTRFSDRIFCVSYSTRNKLARTGINGNKITNIMSGINMDDYKARVKKKKNQIIYIGRHVFYKNVEDLIQAFSLIYKNYPGLKLKILGEGALTDKYKGLVKSLNIEDNVEFAGFVSHIEKVNYIHESLCLVLPSSFEGFGLATIEANACSIPYIAYDIPAAREITNMTKGGILVEHRNVNELARKIEYLVKNRKYAAKLGRIGRKNVEKIFTWEMTAKRLENPLKRLD